MKIKIDLADKYFSLYIRERDGNKCRKCGGTSGLQCSHFQGRRKEATRFDPENADCLCFGCHAYFTANPYEHVQWQIKTKGQQAVDMIVFRSNQYCRKDRKMQQMIWQQAYLDLKSEKGYNDKC